MTTDGAEVAAIAAFTAAAKPMFVPECTARTVGCSRREHVEVLQRLGHGAVVEHEDLERRARSWSGEQCLQTEAEQREVVVRDDDERNDRVSWMA